MPAPAVHRQSWTNKVVRRSRVSHRQPRLDTSTLSKVEFDCRPSNVANRPLHVLTRHKKAKKAPKIGRLAQLNQELCLVNVLVDVFARTRDVALTGLRVQFETHLG